MVGLLAITVAVLPVTWSGAAHGEVSSDTLTMTGTVVGTPYTHSYTGTIDPAFVDPANPPAGGVRVVLDELGLLNTPRDPGSLCENVSVPPSTQPLTAFPFYTQFVPTPPDPFLSSAFYSIGPFTGTVTGSQDFVCTGSTYDHYQRFHFDYTIPASTLATLPTGCYRAIGYNPNTGVITAREGDLPILTIGDVTCRETETVVLSGISSHSGGFLKLPGYGSAVNASVSGTDRARVEAPSSRALAAVAELCVVARWSATTKLAVATTAPMFWNGEVGPFEETTHPGWTLVSRSQPNTTLKDTGEAAWKGLYTETVDITRCGPPDEVVLGADLEIVSPGRMQQLVHSGRFLAYDAAANRLAETSVPGTATDRRGRLNVDAMAPPVTFNVVVN